MKYISILILFVVSLVSSLGIVKGYSLENEGYSPVLEQFKYGRTYNAFYIPMWKVEIIKEYNLEYDYFLLLNIITNLECGKENGSCLGSDNGPFQFNYIHKEIYKVSKQKVLEKDYEGLYRYQVELMIERINRFNKNCGIVGSELWYKCQLGRHNGSGTYGSYAGKGIELYKVLSKEEYRLKELYNNYETIIKKEGFTYIPFIEPSYTEWVLSSEIEEIEKIVDYEKIENIIKMLEKYIESL